jgi:predicted nucleotidyltransferase
MGFENQISYWNEGSNYDLETLMSKLHAYKNLLKETFEVKEMYLFGSYAVGKFHKDSDIDVAIVVDKIKGDYFEYTPILWRLRRAIDIRIEPLLFEDGVDDSGFLSTIKKEGISI